MGEVYRARDVNLKRDVAIKILPEAFANEPDRVSRFQREAEVLASLSHAHIAAIYDLHVADGSKFLVLELVEGETLAERLSRGPMPVEEALVVARQIAEALEAAHEKGIIHRDLKPANIKIAADEKVKVLDFGLAKMFETESAATQFSNSPTMSVAHTAGGVILGTAAYMSPEQARGKTVDRRTDIWAFGCLLYEMFTGRQAFAGETVTDILARIIERGPEMDQLPQAVSPHIRRIIQRCLQKDIHRRYQDIGDVRVDLETPAIESVVVPTSGFIGRRSGRVGWVFAGVAMLGLIAVLAYFLTQTQPVSITRFEVIKFDFRDIVV